MPLKRKITGCILLLFSLHACQRPAPPPMPQPAPLEEARNPEPPVIEPSAELAGLPQAPGAKLPTPVIHPESVLAAPDRDAASRRVAYDTLVSARAMASKRSAGWQYRRTRDGKIVGFEFSNHGGNPILPPRRDSAKNQFFTRDFQFRFDDRARQDIHLLITDWAPSPDRQFRLSELMNSLLHFFPRLTLPAIRNDGDRNIVTLPTGEEVEFDVATHEIRDGALGEAPVDLSADRSRRRFPRVEYRGRGVVVRTDARGADPRLGTTAIITRHAPSPQCGSGGPCPRCEVPSRELWEQTGAMRFRFATDDAFDDFLSSRCGFRLPRSGGKFAVAGSSK